MPEDHQNKTNLSILQIQNDIKYIKEYLAKINGESKATFDKVFHLIELNTNRVESLEKADIVISDQVKMYRFIMPIATAIIGALTMFILTSLL